MGRFPGAYLGFRTWKLEAGVLMPAICGDGWANGGPTKAKCHNGTMKQPHLSPHASCTCGLHLFHDPPEHLYTSAIDGILGAVVYWGRLAVHVDGSRAEWGLPVGFAATPATTLQSYNQGKAFAGEWDLPFFETIEELVDEGHRYADAFPEDQRPKGYESWGHVAPPPPPSISPLANAQAAANLWRQQKRYGSKMPRGKIGPTHKSSGGKVYTKGKPRVTISGKPVKIESLHINAQPGIDANPLRVNFDAQAREKRRS